MLLVLLACVPADKAPPAPARDDTAGDTDPADTDPGDTDPADTDSGDTDPGDTDPADTDSGDTDAGDTDTGDSGARTPDEACAALVAAAEALLAALPADQADAISFDYDDPRRTRWSNLPVDIEPRDGVQVGDMDAAAQAAAWALLEASLSEVGYAQARSIVALDDYDPTDPLLGSRFYTFALYGEPSAGAAWAWQFDGHHLVYDFTVACPDVGMAPTLLGAQPLTVPDGDMAGMRAIGAEQDEAFALLDSLAADQRRRAVQGTYDVPGLAAGPTSDGTFPEPVGLPGSELTLDQEILLTSLIERWVEDQDEPYAALRMAEIVAELDDTYFLWTGGDAPDTMHYYRVHGPTVWIEFDCAGTYDHAHAVYRNPVGDYGGDVLAAHYARSAHGWAR